MLRFENTSHNAVNPKTPDINVINYVFASSVEGSLSYEFSKFLNLCPRSDKSRSVWIWGSKGNPEEQVEER